MNTWTVPVHLCGGGVLQSLNVIVGKTAVKLGDLVSVEMGGLGKILALGDWLLEKTLKTTGRELLTENQGLRYFPACPPPERGFAVFSGQFPVQRRWAAVSRKCRAYLRLSAGGPVHPYLCGFTHITRFSCQQSINSSASDAN
jgi:hypothetical protein